MNAKYQETEKKIIIVGAGIAAIAAARELYKGQDQHSPRQHFDLKILEASRRAGGRVLSTEVDGIPVDLGATFIHGNTNENVIYELAKQFGQVSGSGDWRPMWNESTMSVMLTNGELLPNKTVIKCWEKFLALADEGHAVLADLETPSWSTQYKDMYTFLATEYPKVLGKDHHTMDVPSSHYYRGFFKCLLKFQAVVEGDSDCKGTAVQGDFYDLPGIRDYRFSSGYSFGCFVKKLLEDLPKDVIHYGREVVSIDTASNPTSVKCKNGDQFEADYVIVTVPLGVLKRRCLDENLLPNESPLFVPPLPVEKLKAIRELGFGCMGKMILKFDQEITTKCMLNPLLILWQQEDEDDPIIKQKFPWVTEFVQLERICNSNLYETWMDASMITVVENASEGEIAEAFSYILGKMFQHPVPKPVGVYMHRWSSDPLFYGTYTTDSVNVDTSACIATLEQPLYDNRLLFAGEATSADFYSTMHGAYWTGIREASRIKQTM